MSNQEPCCPTEPVRDPLGRDEASTLASAFKVLGDPVRLRLLSVIAAQAGGEACVCDISPSFDVSQPTISHHLKVLRDNGFVTSERRGTWVYYRIVPSALTQLTSLLTELAGTEIAA
ncbi:helix-turn-helix transcriptional regulator [Rhodococcus sp. BP-252]|uniref:Transcriptional regulator n=1 Tax=Rhodococcoides kyotonense TaxID=398843 RepID=A0A177YI97_9NOCA|nr:MULTISPECIES: metalloregulator ArsR/SmtB family transcription factor [Rhodococcus]MBY6412329.1 helix-turn-helix transcriptional regulator [Rhodococcus sp. BP-320]MBY6416909.1 helix-turn-helix transcriptional regulator [Rhodococcus sp. BP-321]MBY6421553.1 helix-turn-helix transcriptional regulator [Rhodococcus sp. BP-324]MBY6426819.1 helix-turn-helix transcriptional regulator [Rhodococcus sp. BP-323]MBY6431985.1 helix-turn-helix transcriptional regulator [Rhodococcus sp. BP-322]